MTGLLGDWNKSHSEGYRKGSTCGGLSSPIDGIVSHIYIYILIYLSIVKTHIYIYIYICSVQYRPSFLLAGIMHDAKRQMWPKRRTGSSRAYTKALVVCSCKRPTSYLT